MEHRRRCCYAQLSEQLYFREHWTEKRTDNDLSEWEYCGLDAISTLILSYKLESELNESGMKDLYKHINDLALSLAKIQERGIKIDVDARKKMVHAQGLRLKKIKTEIEKKYGAEFNPNSPKQVKELLYNKLKFPVIYVKRKISSDEASLRKLAQRYPEETILRNIINYRKVSKLINTFLDVNLDDDGIKRFLIFSTPLLFPTGIF